jgi:hypothetical protein
VGAESAARAKTTKPNFAIVRMRSSQGLIRYPQ